MEEIVALLLSWGLIGLIAAAFTESFCSPILPDVVLIPLALAQPEYAIYYGILATGVSVLGGFIGYGIGRKIGPAAAHKLLPARHEEKIRHFADRNATWAVFLAAMSPIPYKFVSISAGALKINFTVFVVASSLGRAKRFLVEGILIYYYGPAAVQIFTQHTGDVLLASSIAVIVLGTGIYVYKKMKKKASYERA